MLPLVAKVTLKYVFYGRKMFLKIVKKMLIVKVPQAHSKGLKK